MSDVLSLRLAPVLENCSDQLDILGHTLILQISRERGIAAAQLNSMQQVKPGLTKLRRDCQYNSQQVSKQHLELKEKQVFTSLLQVVEEEKQRKARRREAKRELWQRKQTQRRQQEEFQQKTDKFQDMCHLVKEQSHQIEEEESQIPNMTETAEKRAEQLSQRESNRAKKQVEDQLKLEGEMKLHAKSKDVLQNRNEEVEQLLQQWQHRTKQMLQETEQQLNSVCCKRTVNMDRLMEKRRQFRVMEHVMVEEKEEQEKLRQQQAEARAATKLQAWWRGCMVRRGLGSFKKAEEDKKDKKKKKEGKKKKK